MARWIVGVCQADFDPAMAHEIFAGDYIYHIDPKYCGVEGIKKMASDFRNSVTGKKNTIINQVCDGEWLATLFICEGTLVP